MQNDKLKELTDRLYNEGLDKGRQEGERCLEEAKDKASGILDAARREAAEIVAAAEKEASDLRAKAVSDIRMASSQALQATKKDIENLLVFRMASQKELSDTDFLKKIILAVAQRFSATQGSDIALVLPENLKDELEPWVSGELGTILSSPVQASFSKKIAGGFTIGPGDGSYFISMSDKTFNELIAEYLRPVTRKLLFGE